MTRPNVSQLIKINTVRVFNLQPEISQVYHAKLDIVNTSLFLIFNISGVIDIIHITMCLRVLRDAPPAVARYCKRKGYG